MNAAGSVTVAVAAEFAIVAAVVAIVGVEISLGCASLSTTIFVGL